MSIIKHPAFDRFQHLIALAYEYERQANQIGPFPNQRERLQQQQLEKIANTYRAMARAEMPDAAFNYAIGGGGT